MRYSKFDSIKVKATGIIWDCEGLPNSEECSVGFDTLLANGIVEEDADAGDWFIDERSLRFFMGDILKDDYGERPKDFGFIFTIVPKRAECGVDDSLQGLA